MQKDMPHARIAHRPHVAHVVALRRLHLDHVRAHGRQDLRGEWPQDHRRHVQNLHARQRPLA
ncbi:hypothetical protein SDC9_174664 [bioreactor metagenome]|uniref:Uncharacterized protein n=1 Tax=bioreactor metagenome TaxID=1076179 RepID=A0A645GLY8_9ZZZZ